MTRRYLDCFSDAQTFDGVTIDIGAVEITKLGWHTGDYFAKDKTAVPAKIDMSILYVQT